MSAWEEIEAQLKHVNQRDSGKSYESQTAKEARLTIRRTFLALQARADERDTLRSMLLEKGSENARLTLDVESLQIQLAAAIRAALTQPAHEGDDDPSTPGASVSGPTKGNNS